MADELVPVIRDDEARVNITFANKNGDLPQPVFAQSSDADIKAWVTEADSTITFSAGPCNYQGQLPEAPSPTMSGYGSCRVPTSTGLVEVYWSATRR